VTTSATTTLTKLRLLLLLLLLGQKTGGESFYDKVRAIVGIGFVGTRARVCRVCAVCVQRLSHDSRGGLGV
jgi:hypothetical protein